MKIRNLLIATLLIGLLSCSNAVEKQEDKVTSEITTLKNTEQIITETIKYEHIDGDYYKVSNDVITKIFRIINTDTTEIVLAPTNGFEWINSSLFSLEDLNLNVIFSFENKNNKYTVVGIANGGDYLVHILKGNLDNNSYLKDYSQDNFPSAQEELKNEVLSIVGANSFSIKNNILFATGFFNFATYEITRKYSFDNFEEINQDYYTINKQTKTTKEIKLFKTEKLQEVLITLANNTSVEILGQKYINVEEINEGNKILRIENEVIFKIKTPDNRIGFYNPNFGDMGDFEGVYRNM